MANEATPDTRPRRGSAVLIYVVGIAAVVLVAVLVLVLGRGRHEAVANEKKERSDVAAAGIPVTVAPVAPAAPIRTIEVPGDVRPYRQTTIYAKVAGYLREIRVDRGDVVKENDVIGVVSVPETDQQLGSLEAELRSRKQLFDRIKALVPAGVSSQAELDRASADLKTIQAEVDRLNAVRGYNVIRAPWAGTVTTRYADPGTLMPAAVGSTQNVQPLIDLVDMSRVRITVYLGQLEAPLVKEGDPVTLIRDSDPGRPIPATLTRLSRTLDPRTRTMPVEIEVPNKDNLFYPGLFVRVKIAVKAAPALAIPAEGVFVRSGKPMVAKLESGHAKFTEIQVADDDGKTIRLAGGLAAGDVVIMHPGDEISDGAPVQPVQPDKPAEAAAPAAKPGEPKK
jgi:RND family efflux transporter MFP subunit